MSLALRWSKGPSTRKVDACCVGHHCVQMRGHSHVVWYADGWFGLWNSSAFTSSRAWRGGCTAVQKSSAPPHPAPEHARILRRRRRLANRVWPVKALLRTLGRANPCVKRSLARPFSAQTTLGLSKPSTLTIPSRGGSPGTRSLAVRHVQDPVIGESYNVTHRERAVGPKMRRIATVRKAKWKSLETLQTCGCAAFCKWRRVCHSLADSARTG